MDGVYQMTSSETTSKDKRTRKPIRWNFSNY